MNIHSPISSHPALNREYLDRRYYTREDDEKILEMYQSGSTYEEIGRVIGRHGSSIRYRLGNLGIDLPTLKKRGEMADNPIIRAVFSRAKERKLSLRELADRAGYSLTNISYYRTGLRQPKVSVLQDLCEVVGLKLTVTPAGDA